MQRHYYQSVCLVLISLLSWYLSSWAASGLIILDAPLRLSFTGFASSLTVVGDLDGDGVPDYLVGAYKHSLDGSMNQGRAFVLSGQSGSLLLTLDNPYPQHDATLNPHHGPAFGCAVAAVGDVDRDGMPDLLIGAFNQESSGRAFVFSGKTGQLLYTLQTPEPQVSAGFGWSVAALGDLTGDGISELIIGAPNYEGEGRAFVFGGQSGQLLWTLGPPSASSYSEELRTPGRLEEWSSSESLSSPQGEPALQRRPYGMRVQPQEPLIVPGGAAFGWSVAGAGDLNQDGFPDILVGAPYTTVGNVPIQGRVYAFSGRSGKLLYIIDDPSPRAGAVFGWHVSAGGDFNQDGVPDVLVGAPYKDVGSIPSQGEAFVFSGADGTLLFALQNPAPTKAYAGFGHVVAASPDVNQDGIPEILVGAPYQTVDEFHIQGEVFLFSGRDGRHLTTFDNPYPHQGSMFGYSMAVPGDVDEDGIPDFAIGAFGQTILDKVAVGRVYVFLSRAERAEAVKDDRLRLGRRTQGNAEAGN